MRLAAYGAISTSLAMAVILAAFQQRSNFYSACVYLSQNNACLMILTNMGVFLTILLGFTVQKLFFGHLRAIEEAHLRERTWFAVTETFLAMTVFRDEFNTRFVVMFVSLLFVKCFHWICQDRIDYMEQFPTIPWRFHVRMVSAMILFLAADIAFISHAIDITIRHGASMMIMFGFEFILLAATITAIFVKYILNVIDSRHSEAWENRSKYMFYLELVTDFFKLLTYLAFFSIILTYYGLPLHIIRDVYITLRSFAKKLMSFIRYRQATAHMNERYPDATAEELEATGDRTCIICREQMIHGGEAGRERTRPKKLRCGHILHFHCLRSWLERQQSCPTCRRPVLEETPLRPAPGNRLLIPPPPMPAQAPLPVNIQLPIPGELPPPPAAPGPPPPPVTRTMPRIVAGGPITLPPGYSLPPGWAVIPAHNVQIIPPPGQTPATAGVQVVVQQGPIPVPAGLANGNGDVTNTTPIPPNNGQVSGPPGQTATTPTGINLPPTPATATAANTNTSTVNSQTAPNLMQRPAHRVWANQSPHLAFPIAVPLFRTAGNTGIQYRSNPIPSATGQGDGMSTSPAAQTQAPRVNGVTNTSNENRETEERMALLNQMGASVRAMQDLVAKMSILIPSQVSPTSVSDIPPEAQISPPVPLTPGPSTVGQEHSSSDTGTSYEHTSDTSPSRNLPPLRIQKRRSFSPVDRTNENEHHHHPSDRLHRLSFSEDDLSPEELADIRAPWVEQPLDLEIPLAEVRNAKPGSPPRLRSASQSPSRTLRRRGSLLKHDITNAVLQERGRERERSVDGNIDVVDKGKGKEVYVEDGSEGE